MFVDDLYMLFSGGSPFSCMHCGGSTRAHERDDSYKLAGIKYELNAFTASSFCKAYEPGLAEGITLTNLHE